MIGVRKIKMIFASNVIENNPEIDDTIQQLEKLAFNILILCRRKWFAVRVLNGPMHQHFFQKIIKIEEKIKKYLIN